MTKINYLKCIPNYKFSFYYFNSEKYQKIYFYKSDRFHGGDSDKAISWFKDNNKQEHYNTTYFSRIPKGIAYMMIYKNDRD